ncbi:M48 family metallopeptidase [Alkalimarinus coralli]|uniref:M48 family metallopeptidase n=1 Tax=Alkalimarinus coralli TaxID=2935863 RepID=UPI00202B7BA3|nr:M48 family metallopeptidase [Alkalimarinus coralli]
MGALEQFDVISEGYVSGSRSIEDVKGNIEKKLKLSSEQAERILSAGTLLRKSVTKDEAARYKKTFLALGVGITIQGAAAQAQSAKSNELSQREIEKRRSKALTDLVSSTFSDPIPRLPVSLKYKLGVVTVSLLSLVAPLLYLLLVTASLGFTAWYGLSIPGWFETNVRGANQAVFIFLPLLVSGVFTLFLIKPFFSTYKKQPELELNPKKHYRFYHLINTLAESMGLPSPAHIYVNGEVNAFVAPKNGFFSLLKRDLTLTVGLPLLAGLNSKQLVGVLGHEFGHFRQRNAMIANYIVNTANQWMASRAFEEDAWDQRLEKWNESAPFFILNVGIMGAQLMIKLTRFILKYLFLFNLSATRWMSREMEYDADRYECWVSGSSTFRETAIELRKMGLAEQRSYDVGRRAWNEGHLIENIPAAIVAIADQLTADDIEAIQCQMEKDQTNVWDTHPADNNRINHADLQKFEAVWEHDFPASELMPKFEALCKTVTLRQFNQWGIDSPEQYVKPYAEILGVTKRQAESENALERYFGGLFTMRLMHFPSSVGGVDDVSSVISQISNQYLSIKSLIDDYWEQYNQLVNLNWAIAYLEAGYRIDPSEFGLHTVEVDGVNREITSKTEALQLSNTNVIKAFDSLMAQRIQFAIDNMTPEDKQKTVALYDSLRQFGLLKDIWTTHDLYLQRLKALLEDDEEERPATYDIALKNTVERNIEFIRQFQHIASMICLQFETAKGQSLKAFSLTWGVDLDEELGGLGPASIYEISDGCARVIRFTYHRTMGELAYLCDELEAKLSVKPISVPADDAGGQ